MMLKNDDNKSTTPRQRRASFSSCLIMTGIMPDCVQLEDPSINVVMMYDKKTPPKLEDIVLAVDKLFIYHRLSTVPKRMKGCSSKWWDFESAGNIDPKEMIREENISCDTKEDLATIVQQQRSSSLRKENLPWWEFVLLINKGNGDHVLLFRIDHSIADGLSLGKAFTNIIKRVDGSTIPNLIPPSMISKQSSTTVSKKIKMLLNIPKAFFDVITSPIGRLDDPIHFSKPFLSRNIVSSLIYFSSKT
jgi:hypothetical protein